MKEYEFNATMFYWRENENGTKSLIVRCHESEDSRLVINCGAHQIRFVDNTAPEGIFKDEAG